MISPKDIEKLASLARIAMTDAEKADFSREIESILGYVSDVKKISSELETAPSAGVVHNVLREDVVLNETGACTEELISAAPARQGNYVKVKKIL